MTDEEALTTALATAAAQQILSQAENYLDDQLERGSFNRARAEEVLTIAMDNAFYESTGYSARSLAQDSRVNIAKRLTDDFVRSRGARDQRAERRGVLAKIF